VFEKFEKGILCGFDCYFVRDYSGELQNAIIYCQEDSGIKITKRIARIHLVNLVQYVKKVLIKLEFNMCEVGCEEWADQETRLVISVHHVHSVPTDYSGAKREKPISCITTRLTEANTSVRDSQKHS
jgi:hypothetical protein